MITRTRITATPLYPGSFYPEPGRAVEILNGLHSTALATVEDDGKWFALEVRTVLQKRWTDGDGGVMWTDESKPVTYRIYVGDVLTVDDVAKLPGDHEILLSNMRGNGWLTIVRTRAGNFQPIKHDDVVVSAVPPITR